ncbi:MAG: demethylmenaquinone methyltransferase [Actinomycetota bacterium]|nr:demethylmenaquinone methyltransferase [Actinomycetota bacterium]
MKRADLSKRPDEVAGMFDDVAPGYDRTNNLLSVGNAPLWRAATTRAVAPKAGERILDVAAGTGTSSVSLSKTGATVVAVDFSEGMVEIGRKRHKKIEFHVADAERLPFGDDEFDAVAISFGLRNIADPRAALSEMYRVMKPGGRLVICEFSTPPNGIFRVAYRTYLRYVMPVVVGRVSSNPEAYKYLNESIEAWPDQATLSQWIRAAGFTRVAWRNLTGGVVALHRGHKPQDPFIRASVARRRASRRRPTRAAS